MKFARNYSLITGQLMPDLYQMLTAAKGCVDHNYAYEVWELATTIPIDAMWTDLPESISRSIDVWGHSKIIRFHLKQPEQKKQLFERQAAQRRAPISASTLPALSPSAPTHLRILSSNVLATF